MVATSLHAVTRCSAKAFISTDSGFVQQLITIIIYIQISKTHCTEQSHYRWLEAKASRPRSWFSSSSCPPNRGQSPRTPSLVRGKEMALAVALDGVQCGHTCMGDWSTTACCRHFLAAAWSVGRSGRRWRNTSAALNASSSSCRQ